MWRDSRADQVLLDQMMGSSYDADHSNASLFIHSQLDDLSAAFITVFTNNSFTPPLIPSILHNFHTDHPTKTLAPASTGIDHTFQPLFS
jgi:hypothetical protein